MREKITSSTETRERETADVLYKQNCVKKFTPALFMCTHVQRVVNVETLNLYNILSERRECNEREINSYICSKIKRDNAFRVCHLKRYDSKRVENRVSVSVVFFRRRMTERRNACRRNIHATSSFRPSTRWIIRYLNIELRRTRSSAAERRRRASKNKNISSRIYNARRFWPRRPGS